MVLQWRAGTVFPDRQTQDRAMADQRMAVLRPVQSSSGSRWANPVASKWKMVVCRQPVRSGPGHTGRTGTLALPHRRQRPVQVLRQSRRRHQQGSILGNAGPGLRKRRRRELLWHWEERTEAKLYRLHGLQPALVPQGPFSATLSGGAIDNPGRYLVLLPPINGATAFSGTPYFT